MEKYYVIHNPVERTAPFVEQISLVKVLEGKLTPLNLVVTSKKFNPKNFEFIEDRLKIVNTPLAPYCKIEEVRKETFESLSGSFN